MRILCAVFLALLCFACSMSPSEHRDNIQHLNTVLPTILQYKIVDYKHRYSQCISKHLKYHENIFAEDSCQPSIEIYQIPFNTEAESVFEKLKLALKNEKLEYHSVSVAFKDDVIQKAIFFFDEPWGFSEYVYEPDYKIPIDKNTAKQYYFSVDHNWYYFHRAWT